MHQAIIKIKTDSESESVFFYLLFNSNSYGTLLLKISIFLHLSK
jgi:hypothetical protein